LKDKILKIIQETMPKVVEIEIIGNFVKCYEAYDLFEKRMYYYTNDLKYWIDKLERKTRMK